MKYFITGANGFVGRTVIHPNHIKFVNSLMAVTKEEYDDAIMILGNSQGGVVKGTGANGPLVTCPWVLCVGWRSVLESCD